MTWRTRLVCFGAVAIYLALSVVLASFLQDAKEPADFPLGFDFSAYYEAAQLARQGDAVGAYDDATILAAEHARFPHSTMRLVWSYPPTFQGLLLPFTLLPYAGAYASWSLLLLFGHGVLTRRLASRAMLWPLLLFPGAVINLLGANGLLVALLLGGGLLLLDRRPVVAGVLLGLATFKPHLAWLVPLALIAGKRHRALLAMIATTLLLVSITTLAFGIDPWRAFVERLLHGHDVAAAGNADWTRVPTIYTLGQVLGWGKAVAGAAHGIVALAASAAALWLWRVGAKPVLRNGALLLALLIVTPYARIYDFALLLFPIVALVDAMDPSPTVTDRMLLAWAWIAPLVGLILWPTTAWLAIVPVWLLGRLFWGAMGNSGSAVPAPA